MNYLKLDWRIRLLNRIVSFSKPLEKMSRDKLRETFEKAIPQVMERLLVGKQIASEVVRQNIDGQHGTIPIQLY